MLAEKTHGVQNAVTSASLLATPWWIDYVEPFSRECAVFAPIVGVVLGAAQLFRTVQVIVRRK
jgi:hypothetical protein